MVSNTHPAVAALESVCADPYGTARRAATQGQRVAGYMCTYVPEELFHAAGYLPVRIFGWTDGTQHADSLLQTYACSLARGALNAALSGQLDFLNLMAFAHTCDTIQNLTDIWQRNVPQMQHIILSTPVNTTGDAALTFFTGELRRMRRLIEQQRGPVADDALWASIRLYDEVRATMRQLYAARRANPRCLTARQMLAVTLASFLIRKDDYLPHLKEVLAYAQSAPDDGTDNRPRVFVVGSVCQTGDYLGAIEDAGCIVADDDLCNGARAFAGEAAMTGDPIECLARTYLTRRPCPAKHTPGYDRGAELLDQARRANADGVIFLFTKFCDPWCFDYPLMRQALENAALPSLLIEIEQYVPPSAHFTTRVAAFAEMLTAAMKGSASS